MTQSTKFEFRSDRGELLAGRLEMPANRPTAMAVFAHCFTCGKNARAATYISRELASLGIGVLRFDFTGLGNSEGDFANTSFTSNVQDLIAASSALTETYSAPQLMIGHSLGGTAALIAAGQLPHIRAVATIGSPATPQHVTRLFSGSIEQIELHGAAEVDLAGRRFKIGKQMVDDLRSPDWRQKLTDVRAAVLICHSPDDTTVNITEATQLYKTLSHPKSFLSLDGADHLLVNKSDGQYVAKMVAAWASRYLDVTNPMFESEDSTSSRLADGELLVREVQGFTNEVTTVNHRFLADEPVSLGGANLGMNPYELLLAALGTCTSMTLRMYANHKQLPLQGIRVRLKHQRIDASKCNDCESESGKISVITKTINISGDLTAEQVKRLGEIADRCPVHRTLMQEKKIESTIDIA